MGRVRRLVLLGVLAALLAAPAALGANPPALPSRSLLTADRANFVSLAEKGLAQTKQLWWNNDLGWYDDRLDDTDRLPLATIWSAYGLWEATNAVAIAHPTAANKAAVSAFAAKATKYWNPDLKPVPGFVYYYTARGPWNAYMDDNAWWGLGFIDAYKATGNKVWLNWAARALRYMDVVGWDKTAGGMWWDADQHKKTSEGLAGGTLIAALLYGITHKPTYLAMAKKYLTWANAKTVNKQQGNLYGRSDTDPTIMNYVEGMVAAAYAELCTSTKTKAYCTRANLIANASLNEFPILATWAPETDVIYERWLLDLYTRTKNPRWYAVAYANAKAAVANAQDDQGLWSKRWDGDWTKPGLLRTQGATLALLAWTAATAPPPLH
jgi:uncharacterized protein YyaL (SSP411 family)